MNIELLLLNIELLLLNIELLLLNIELLLLNIELLLLNIELLLLNIELLSLNIELLLLNIELLLLNIALSLLNIATNGVPYSRHWGASRPPHLPRRYEFTAIVSWGDNCFYMTTEFLLPLGVIIHCCYLVIVIKAQKGLQTVTGQQRWSISAYQS